VNEKLKNGKNAKMKIQISKMERSEHQGDWHDKPLRWQAVGPDSELQKFSTKKEASLWAKIRRRATSQFEAFRTYVAS